MQTTLPQLKSQFHPEGPCPSPLMIVGEAPSEKDAEKRRPFSSTTGWLLDQILSEAGLARGLAFLTNVLREVPPYNDPENWMALTLKARAKGGFQEINGMWVNDKISAGRSLLLQEVELCRPSLIIAYGNLTLWALLGKWGIRKWRGSVLEMETPSGWKCKVIPMIHPSAVLREWTLRKVAVADLKRAKKELARGAVVEKPKWNFVTRPSFSQALDALLYLENRLNSPNLVGQLPLAADIETRAGHTACLGIAWSRTQAICIPWMCVERPEGYWTADEELTLVKLTRQILSHPRAKVIWQNGAYDHQYEHRWHFYLPGLGWDTMLAHHAMFSISPKALDYLSSIYCDQHVYWKEDGKLWDPSIPEDDFWHYNCEDCVRTFEIAEEEESAIEALTPSWPRLPEVVAFQHAIQPVIVKMMLRGVRSDEPTRKEMGKALDTAIDRIQGELETLAGQSLNINSPKQMTEFFYDVLHQTPIFKRLPNGTRGNPTCDDEALLKVAGREPLLRPLVGRIQALRSAVKFKSTYVEMQRDTDGRLRCSYNVAGTKTYRLASAENAFGSGGNLQNIPSGDDDSLILLPNIRKLFLFDEGMTGFDLDGDSADLRIVTGESGCRQMQAYFAAKVKPYVEIAKEFYRDPTITKHHPSYKKIKGLCHGSNYGGEPAGLSERIGLPVHDISRIQNWYFGMCPEILQWQNDIKSQGEHRGYIENPFGYRRYNWDRWSRKIANEFLAWIPQSTVGLLINKIALAIDRTLPDAELLLQVHDSLTGQFPSTKPWLANAILEVAEGIEIPCKTGVIKVPAGMKTSTKSWGDCQ